MDKQLLQELITYLDEVKAFLDDCDEGLAGEVSAKDKIAGRIWKAAGDMPRLKHLARDLMTQQKG
ncbi:MAG: hypothetical protein MJ075_01815 [Oscillospiraceae bacterium]|nr:hypothetical protein [Oscillospiraceae bacterium]